MQFACHLAGQKRDAASTARTHVHILAVASLAVRSSLLRFSHYSWGARRQLGDLVQVVENIQGPNLRADRELQRAAVAANWHMLKTLVEETPDISR